MIMANIREVVVVMVVLTVVVMTAVENIVNDDHDNINVYVITVEVTSLTGKI